MSSTPQIELLCGSDEWKLCTVAIPPCTHHRQIRQHDIPPGWFQVERQHPTVEGKVITKWIAPQDMGRLLRTVVKPLSVSAGNSRLQTASKTSNVDDSETDADMPELVPAKCVYDYSKCRTGRRPGRRYRTSGRACRRPRSATVV